MPRIGNRNDWKENSYIDIKQKITPGQFGLLGFTQLKRPRTILCYEANYLIDTVVNSNWNWSKAEMLTGVKKV